MACNRWPEVCGTSSYARLQASLGMADASTASEQECRHPADRLKNDLTNRQTNSRESLKNLESHNEHCEWVSCRENRRLWRCKRLLSLVAYDRKAVILRVQIWSKHSGDVVGIWMS